jgi:tetratricopeptide (TPR) repeat protein
MKCANCGTQSDGNFCPSCGAAMRAGKCAACGARLVPGARFCTSCGAEAGAGKATSRRGRAAAGRAREEGAGNLPWYIAGAVLVVLILVLGLPLVMGEDDSPPARGTAPFPGAAVPGGLAPLEGTPREQADRLFNRVMTAREQGNAPEALQFAPMGIQAYQMAEPLDDDGLYHLATLQNTASDFAAARATAERILSRNPNHLLGLAAAAEAATGAGDAAAAREYHQRLLDAYDAELARALPEYQDHARILPDYRQAAQQAVR